MVTSTGANALRAFMPGAFASISVDIRREFRTIQPDAELEFHPFIPSGELARKIKEGAPADVYVSANRRYMNELHRDGLIPEPKRLAGNRLCIIVRPDRADQVTELGDLFRSGVRVVTPQSGSDPCGQYIVKMLDRAGLTSAARAKEETGELVHSFGSGDLPGFLEDGRVDAGMFYASEVLPLGDRVVMRELPRELDMREEITFMIGEVRRQAAPNPAAAELVDFMVGPPGQALMEAHGFLPLSALDSGSG